jgi:hypothetical protein
MVSPSSARAHACALAFFFAVGCASVAPSDPSIAVLADRVVDAPGATGEGFGDATLAVNGVHGGGNIAGSVDVYSLGYDERPYVVLGWTGARVTNGPGADLVVFENAFRTTWAADEWFMDPAIVEVSLDGETWVAFPHDYVATDETMYSPHEDDWIGFAGVTPVVFDSDETMDAFDPLSGGDTFDLDALGTDGLAGEIRQDGFRFVRITSAAIVVNEDTGMVFPRERISNGADVDGIAARWLVPDDGGR